MPRAEINGVGIYYRIDGPHDAPVLVLSHSVLCDHAMWQPQLAVVEHRYRVLRYDCRGHGRSDVPAAPYSIDGMADDVIGLLDVLGLDRVHFCGLSIGGMVGQSLAVRAPQRVDRLILCNTAMRIGSADLWSARIDTVRTSGMAGLLSVVERWFTPDFRQRNNEVAARFANTLMTTPAEGYVGCCHALAEADFTLAVPAVAAPTLVIAGTADVSTPPDDGHRLAAAIPAARYLELPAAHLSNVEAAQAFNTAVLGFLQEEDAGCARPSPS
jgi:3-oxoadipate enol-lactonase